MVSLNHPSALGHGPRPGARETIALLAALMAMNAVAIDAMIPGLEEIATHFSVAEENRRQLVLVAYTFGFGFGQLLWGPLADRFGRKPTLAIGIGAYVLFASFCAFAPSFEALIAGRALQGAAAASSRVLVMAMVRDLFEGEAMARVMSLVAMVFMIVPVAAPSLGQLILAFGPWQAVFWLFALYGLVIGVWSMLRLPETLRPEHRRSLNPAELIEGARAVFSDPQSRGYTLAQTALFAGLIAYLASVQQIVFDVFQKPQLIGLAFAAVAAPMALASFMNSRLVGRYGLRRVGHLGVVAFATLALTHALIATFIGEDLIGFIALQALVLVSFSFCSSNLNTLAMEKMASVAGMASSLQGVISTILAAIGGFAIGQAFDGTQLPYVWGLSLSGGIALGLMLLTEPRRLFERLEHAHGQAATARAGRAG
ncbi:multidrug effflux MFS transporter [Sphingomonas sp. LHG3406-1]|uniref:multidrug effflux MFS transporter n=1 Tax=Sphingomonas sp. LHG3406-1 TaxID=2804617 RepID=UPI00261491E5|nr:multidrug effflux MFS transporter [Sphingomonas sp. LHG3406-1]